MVLIEAILRNFGGLSEEDTEAFLFPRISRFVFNNAELSNADTNHIWHQFSPLNLIKKNIEQTRTKRKLNTTFELRNIMMITENTALFKILFDANILDLSQTHVIFGSNFQDDKHSNIYLYRTIDKVRSAMIRGDTCLLLKLTQLYDSLYDVLNQRYLTIDNQKFCKICIGGESINCKINKSFKIIVVVPTDEAHHTTENHDNYTPTAFLNRFEKAYLDISLLQKIGIGTNKEVWDTKWEVLNKIMKKKYSDHRMYQYKDLWAGYKSKTAVMSKITLLLSCSDKDDEKKNMDDFENECYSKLLKTTSLQYLIQDRQKLRTRDGFVGYANLIDLLKREGIRDSQRDRNHKLLRVVTYDSYQMPTDFHGNGMKVFESFDAEEKKDIENDDAINTVFVELNNFNREKDFYDYVLSFLDNHKTEVSTLIVIADPIPNNSEKDTIFTHYLHAQYLIEKAKTQSVKPNIASDNDEDPNTAKNVIFLLYMSRANPYPLLFSNNWSHLYVDALSISDHSYFPEIQINDINVFNDEDKAKLLDRVSEHSGRIVKNNYSSALTGIDVTKELHTELERFKLLLDTPGQFYQTLIKRISRVLKDVDTGAERCISNAFRSKPDNRGSFRSQVMLTLGKKIENELVNVLAAIFSNGNSYLYKSECDVPQDNQDRYKKLISKLWLDVLSEPQIVRFKATTYGNQIGKKKKTPINESIKAKFAFSANMHSYFLSFKKSILLNYKKATPIDQSGEKGQSFLLKELSQRLDDANMDFPITNLPVICVKNLLFDIVQLESIRLGIKTGENMNTSELIESVSTFLWQISLKLHQEWVGIKIKQKQQKEKLKKEEKSNAKANKAKERQAADNAGDDNAGNRVAAEESSEEEESDAESDGDDYEISDEEQNEEQLQEQQHNQDNAEEGKDDEKKEETVEEEKKVIAIEQPNYDEQMTVQVHEIYASLWSNQKIILQFIDVLTCVRATSLRNINVEWGKENIAFIDRFGQIMKRILSELKRLLQEQQQHKALKARAEKILAISTSFDAVLEYLQKNEFAQTKTLIINWKRIHLSLICTNICPSKMDGAFIEGVYNRFKTFDNIEDLKWLIATIDAKLTNHSDAAKNDILQYLLQIFVADFAFVKNRLIQNNQKAYNQRNEFLKTLIDICSEEVKIDDENKDDMKENAISLRLNPFSKLQTLSKILQLTRGSPEQKEEKKDDEKEEKKQENVLNIEQINAENKEAETVKMRLSDRINSIAEHQNIDENELALYLLSCEEQYLYYKYKRENENKPITKVKESELKKVIKRLEQSFDSTKLDQLLAIANAKLAIFYFVRFVSIVYRKKGAKFTNKGLEHKKRTVLKISYLATLSSLFKIPVNCEDHNLISIKKGFQYFILSCLWKSVLGPQRAVGLSNVDNFAKKLNIDIMIAMADAPSDNPFKLLCEGDDTTIFDAIESAITFKNNINWQNNKKYIAFVCGSLFNHAYIKKGIKDEYFDALLITIRDMSNKIANEQIDKNNEQKIRVTRFFTTLTANSMCEQLKYKSKKSMEDVQLIRMMYHFMAILLSLPKSPYSILFHDPIAYNDGYLTGMPDDAASQIFKYFKNCGAWLCPNGHMYFIANCSWPNQSLTCETCGAPTGKKAQGARSHEAAPGNKRLGKIDVNGVLNVHPPDDEWSKSYWKYTEFAVYKPEDNVPKGYIEVGPADALRNMNEISLRIVRLFANVVLLMHHGCDEALSKLKDFPAFKATQEHSAIYAKLITRINRYIVALGQKLGLPSNEEVLYLLHHIINEFYVKYPVWFQENDNKNVLQITNIASRNLFETFLVEQCIEPTINDVPGSIQTVRRKCSNTLMQHWSERIEETIDLKSDDGETFSRTFKPNLFLQFRFVTLYQFQTIMLKSVSNEKKHTLQKLYPITYGILNCINLDIGYSVFALQYLPFMITWMKNIKLRLNQRLDMRDIIENSDTYTAQWVLNQCEDKERNWGDADEWRQALDGFIFGWNHVASRVTVDEEQQNEVINRQRSGVPHTPIDDMEDGKDDEKEINVNPNQNNAAVEEVKENKQNEAAANDAVEEEETLTVGSKNPFRKYVVIADACEPLTIIEIKPSDTSKDGVIRPCDVPLSFALDSSSNEFTQSKMIRFMLQHLVEANNRLLRICHELKEDDNGLDKGLSPRLSITELSQQRNNDVVNIDEEELTSLIQQCSKPRLKYGEDCKLDINSFNLRLLETQLRQKFIVGRRFLEFDRVVFEFAGEHNIPLIIEQINKKYKSKTLKNKYFTKTPDVLNGIRLLKFAIEQSCEYDNDEIEDENKNENAMNIDAVENENEMKAEIARKNKMRAYRNSMEAVEQVLIAISREINYPHPQKTELSDYMKQTLHLYQKDYAPFSGTKLKLQHIDLVWRFLEKQYILCEDKWTETPNSILDCYLVFISDNQQTAITQFVRTKDMEELWIFLGGLRRFMQRNCSTIVKSFEPAKAILVQWLTDAQDIKDELKNDLPYSIMMSQIGHMYRKMAEEYRTLLNEQRNNK